MIVLDTHVLLWWVTGDLDKLSASALQAIEAEMQSGDIVVSAISAWEVAMLVSKGRLALSMDVSAWLSVVGEIPAIRFIPVDNDIAIKSADLPGDFHKDPADRIIVSTARQLGAPVVSADEKIRGYPHMRTIW